MPKPKEAGSLTEISPREQLLALSNDLAGKSITNPKFTRRFSLSSIDIRTSMLEELAREKGLNPDIVADYDLPGIEVPDLASFLKEIYFRFFEEESHV